MYKDEWSSHERPRIPNPDQPAASTHLSREVRIGSKKDHLEVTHC